MIFFSKYWVFFSPKIDLKGASNAMISSTKNVFFSFRFYSNRRNSVSNTATWILKDFYVDDRKESFVTELKKASSTKGISNQLLLM